MIRTNSIRQRLLGPTATALAASIVRTAATAAAAGPTPTPASSFLPPYTDPQISPSLTAPWWAVSLDLGLKLLLIVAMIYATIWVLRKFMVNPRRPLGRAGVINVLETTHLAPNRALYLVEVAERIVLLGATQTQLTTLTEISDADQIARIRQQFEKPEVPRFGSQLRAFAERIGATAAGAGPASNAVPAQAQESEGPSDTPGPRRRGDSSALLLEKIAELRRMSEDLGDTKT